MHGQTGYTAGVVAMSFTDSRVTISFVAAMALIDSSVKAGMTLLGLVKMEALVTGTLLPVVLATTNCTVMTLPTLTRSSLAALATI